MSGFANNIEAMGFDKSGWALVETSADGNTIYMGKPRFKDVSEDDCVWYIKRVVKKTSSSGVETIETKTAVNSGNVRWRDRNQLIYKF